MSKIFIQIQVEESIVKYRKLFITAPRIHLHDSTTNHCLASDVDRSIAADPIISVIRGSEPYNPLLPSNLILPNEEFISLRNSCYVFTTSQIANIEKVIKSSIEETNNFILPQLFFFSLTCYNYIYNCCMVLSNEFLYDKVEDNH